jgi:predicted nucleic acid-binding protein
VQTSARVVYLDSSALVKLVVPEAESSEFLEFLSMRPAQSSCALARVEVPRAVLRHGPQAVRRAREVLESVDLIRLDDELLDRAAELQPIGLRSLDALANRDGGPGYEASMRFISPPRKLSAAL